MLECRMCGESNPDDAGECGNCGEPFSDSGSRPDVLAARINSLATVRTGITFVYFGLVTVFLFVIFAVPLSMYERGPLSAAAFGVILLGTLGMVIGRLCCLATPADSNARPFIIFAVLCELASYLGPLAVFPLLFSGSPLQLAIVSTGGMLVGFAGQFLFIFFLRRISNYIDRPELAYQARSVMVLMVMMTGLFVGLTFLPNIGRQDASIVGAAFGLGLLIFGILFITRFGNLLNGLRKALAFT